MKIVSRAVLDVDVFEEKKYLGPLLRQCEPPIAKPEFWQEQEVWLPSAKAAPVCSVMKENKPKPVRQAFVLLKVQCRSWVIPYLAFVCCLSSTFRSFTFLQVLH